MGVVPELTPDAAVLRITCEWPHLATIFWTRLDRFQQHSAPVMMLFDRLNFLSRGAFGARHNFVRSGSCGFACLSRAARQLELHEAEVRRNSASKVHLSTPAGLNRNPE